MRGINDAYPRAVLQHVISTNLSMTYLQRVIDDLDACTSDAVADDLRRTHEAASALMGAIQKKLAGNVVPMPRFTLENTLVPARAPRRASDLCSN